MIDVACKLIRIFYLILTTGTEYDVAKMMGDIQRQNRRLRKADHWQHSNIRLRVELGVGIRDLFPVTDRRAAPAWERRKESVHQENVRRKVLMVRDLRQQTQLQRMSQ